MSATILAAIAPLKQVMLSKDEPTLFVKVVIFGLAGKRGFLFSVFRHVLGLE